MKHKKLIVASLCGVLVVGLIASSLLLHNKKPNEEETTPSTPPKKDEVVVDIPKGDITIDAVTPDKDDNGGLNVDIGSTQKPDSEKVPAKPNEKPNKPQEPSIPTSPDESKPTPPSEETKPDKPNKNDYSCGVSGHHCTNAENHAYISNLEAEGCAFCGSHSCKSFYYVSAAGVPMCNPKLCPEYDSKTDPTQYCQDCGKKVGNGSNGTCEKFLVDGTCPICKEDVKANECHSH